MIMWFIRWYLKNDINYCKYLAVVNQVDRSEVGYIGKTEQYWIGCGDGINDALRILNLESTKDILNHDKI